MASLALISPEVILLATAIVVLFADVLVRGRERAGAWIGVVGAVAATVAAGVVGQGTVTFFGGGFAIDGAAQVARIASGALAALLLMWLAGAGLRSGSVRTFAALALFATMGAMATCGARDWVVLLLSLEMTTMPAYVLVGFDRKDGASLEGALKYFLLSMIASGLFLYGLSFVIGMSGSTAMSATRLEPGLIGALAAAFLSAGLLAKLSAAPFQFWSPDAYEGAPAVAVAYVSAVPKVAGLLAFARIAQVVAPQVPTFPALIIGAALLSMAVGNFAAYPQSDLRRLMAYSGVAHAGYLLVGLAAGAAGASAAVFYAIAYAIPSMGIMLVAATEGERLHDLRGLATRRPWAAWLVVLMLLSLVGVPPLAGFVGKLGLFSAALRAGLVPLTVVGVAMSVVSAGFYFRIIRAMFFETAEVAVAPRMKWPAVASVVLCAAATLAVGVLASPVLAAITFANP